MGRKQWVGRRRHELDPYKAHQRFKQQIHIIKYVTWGRAGGEKKSAIERG